METLRRKLEAEGLYNCTINPDCDESSLLEYCWSCVYVSTPPPPPLVPSQNHITPYLVSAVCALGVAFLILTTCGILLRCRWWRRRNSATMPISTDAAVFRDEDHGPVDHPIWRIVTVGLPDSVIESITAVKYKKGDGLIEGTDCSVCLTEFEEGDDLRLLPKCNHAFHISCIDTWLRSHQNCPLCRSAVVNPSFGSNSSEPDSSRLVRVDVLLNRLDGDEEEEQIERRGQFEPLSVGIAGGISISEILNNNNWGNRALSDLSENHRVVREDFQCVRRTISLDASAASAINNAVVIDVAKLSGEGSSKQEKLVDVEEEEDERCKECEGQNSSISRLMKAPVSMKRSFSSSSARILSSFRGVRKSCSTPSSESEWTSHQQRIVIRVNVIKKSGELL
ncbi:hypothetical protein V2J09_016674 [Rumex salicifolius]